VSARVLPVKEMKAIDSLLPKTRKIEKIVMNYSPQMLALALGPSNNLPNAWTSLLWAAHACQAAHYHLYLAHHDRLYYSKYRRPPKLPESNMIASMFFTSFTLHAVAVENHLAVACLLSVGETFPKNKNNTKNINFGTRYVIKVLKKKSRDLVKPLQQLTKNPSDWQWIREYRERWFHLNPVRIKELGIQFRVSDDLQQFWRVDKKAGIRTLGFGGGDPSEIDVDTVLQRGIKGFKILTSSYAQIVQIMEAQARSQWQVDDPLNKLIKIKKPRKIRTPRELL